MAQRHGKNHGIPLNTAYMDLLARGQSYVDRGDFSQARDLFLSASKQAPRDVRVLSCLGWVFQVLQEPEKARSYYEQAVAVEGCPAEVWNNLGLLYQQNGLRQEAEKNFRMALQLSAGMYDAAINLGRILVSQGKSQEAVLVYKEALNRQPQSPMLHYVLGEALRSSNKLGQALIHLEEALELEPEFGIAHNLIAVVMMDMGMAEQAAAHFQEAIRLTPQDDGPYSNYATLLQSLGRYREAYELARAAIDLAPHKSLIHSNLLFLMNYQEAVSREDIFAEQKSWNERHARHLGVSAPELKPDKDPERKLRIGYVSPDFRLHPVCFFISPILASFDRNRFDVYCYSNVSRPDEQTEALKKLATHWRDICGIPDEEVARWIREDRIDILVDLAGHSGDNRLLVFARKPAPVQVTFLGNPDGTGMEAMDYRISDSWCDPVGLTERYHVETLRRLPGNFFCYAPPSPVLDIAPLPWSLNGYVTFGSFNNFSKISENLLETWGTILHAVPDSRLFFQGKPMADPVKVNELRTFFERRGIQRERILVRGNTSFQEHMKLLGQVDIALDTFPWNGHTTTCHTLWMGVPVVALEGERGISRMGVSILSGLGEENLIARSVEEYVAKAVALAEAPEALVRFRRDIRSRILNSPWGKQEQYNADLDALYRDLWRNYCGVSA